MKNVLILGSKSDVGIACAHKFAANNCNIFLASRTPNDDQKKLAQDLKIRHEVESHVLLFDATNYDSHQSFYQNINEPIDTVVSVFGVLGDHDKAILDFAQAKEIIDVNFLGNVSILGLIANDMATKNQGTIACVSSVAGERGRMSNYLYGSAKAGLTAYLSGLRNRMTASNVHVLSVLPGFIRTKMIEGIETPKPLTATPEEVANTIFKGCQKKKNIMYVKPIWRLIMFVIKSIPEFIFKKLKL